MAHLEDSSPDAVSQITTRLQGLTAERLRGIRRGIEKESLRALPGGALAQTPHPLTLGSALTHPRVTTDFSESQVELITSAHATVAACLAELGEIHQSVYHALQADGGQERLWVSSMPCCLPDEDQIPIGQYGHSNVGRAKTVYRTGLSHRYGRRMQTISGIHYNWSIPGATSDDYFGLIRNFRRQSFVLLWLFGASPAVCKTFVAGLPHGLEPLGPGTLHLPHATSLRMGRLGYQSDAQSRLAVSYNGLAGYGGSLQAALTAPYPAYEQIGLRDEDGHWKQLSTHLLQIENEFYGTIRPKRTIRSGERPLHALRERGVEYVEVRCMDLDPFESIGIGATTAHFLDVFLLHCLLLDSPPDSPEEIAALGRNQHLTAARGREPGLKLERQGREVLLVDWAAEIVDQCGPIARMLDEVHGGTAHADALAAAQRALTIPATLPSARVIEVMQREFAGEFAPFIDARSEQAREQIMARPLPDAEAPARWAADAAESLVEQRRIEESQTQTFEEFLADYLSPARLG
ncbi:glutamate--cysteine ligase [Ideonella lacteola]|uniref:glutamate--cysteine ligase n=1 Tax=Ideonella lacteola TaxID=2984193 RepID=UPI003BF94E30